MAKTADTRGRDIGAGCVFLGIAACFVLLGRNLELGTFRTMGPGFFPLVVSGLLALLGAVTIIGALRRPPGSERIALAWRPLALIVGAPVLFALLVEPFGLVPALGLAVWLSTLGRRPWNPLRSFLLSALVTLFCWLIFVVALGVPIPPVKWPSG